MGEPSAAVAAATELSGSLATDAAVYKPWLEPPPPAWSWESRGRGVYSDDFVSPYLSEASVAVVESVLARYMRRT